MKLVDVNDIKRHKLYMGYFENESLQGSNNPQKAILFFKYRGMATVDDYKLSSYGYIVSAEGVSRFNHSTYVRVEIYKQLKKQNAVVFEIDFSEFSFHIVSEVI